MSVIPCSDSSIDALAADSTRSKILEGPLPADACYLADYWDGLHFLLTRGSGETRLPCAALKVGDVSFRTGTEPAHAIWSSTAAAFARELENLTEATLRQRFDMQAMLKAGVYPIRTWAFPEFAEGAFREAMVYFERLREVVMKAVARGEGLLILRYEDL